MRDDTQVSGWRRIDKGDGSVSKVLLDVVQLAARNYYNAPAAVIEEGRFGTPFAIYSRMDKLTAEEMMNRHIAESSCTK